MHYVNNLNPSGLNPEANVSGIHWHGIELNNQSDGTEVTQAAVGPEGEIRLQVHRKTAGDLLVPPASPLVDQPSGQRTLRVDHC